MELAVYAFILGVAVIIGRLFGSWMLRIDEVIKNQKIQIEGMEKLLKELKDK